MTLLALLGQALSALVPFALALSPWLAPLLGNGPDTAPKDTGTAALSAETDRASASLLETFRRAVADGLRADARYQQAAALRAVAEPSAAPAVAVEDALASIVCTNRAVEGGAVRAIRGSGVFIDSSGVLLTNAHLGQFLLLSKEIAGTTAECRIWHGSPALLEYKAKLLYISPTWIAQNAHQLSDETPSGTGEYDFALLYVTKAESGSAPAAFPALAPLPDARLSLTMPVRAAGYPAEDTAAEGAGAPSAAAVATTTITRLFTFAGTGIDLVALAPSALGERGSSGGPVVNENGTLLGIIATRGNAEREGARSLRALTISYIDRTLLQETGLDLGHTLSGDLALRAQTFRKIVAPHLRALLMKAE